jgi:hypothetical protein
MRITQSLPMLALLLLAACGRQEIDPGISAGDPRPVALAALTAWQGRDPQALAAVSLAADAAWIGRVQPGGSGYERIFGPRNAGMMALVNWDGTLEALRRAGPEVRALLAGNDPVFVAVLVVEDGAWRIRGIESMPYSAFEAWGQPVL